MAQETTYIAEPPATTQQSTPSGWIQNLGAFVDVAGNASNVYWGFTNNPGTNPYANQGGGIAAFMPGYSAGTGSSSRGILLLGAVLALGVGAVMLTKKKK